MDRRVVGRCHTDRVTHGRAEIHELLLANDLRPSRALGQNFVADGNTVRRIVRLAGVEPGTRVVEIGAGLGSLTLALVEAGAEVTAVEVDRHVLPVLRGQVEPLGVTVVEADARSLDFADLLGTGTRVVAGGQSPLQRRRAAGHAGPGGGTPGRLAAGHGPAGGGGAVGRPGPRRGLRGGLGEGGLLGRGLGGRQGLLQRLHPPSPRGVGPGADGPSGRPSRPDRRRHGWVRAMPTTSACSPW